MMNNNKIKLAFIEDNQQYRKALSFILSELKETEIIHELETAQDITTYFKQELPDIVIMDIDLPGKNGIQAVWEIKEQWPGVKILMLTVFEDADKIFNAIKAGANGYLLKKDSPARIREAILQVADGESPINGIIARRLLEYFQGTQQKRSLEKYHLTHREEEILQYLVNGLSYKEIAFECNITFQTLNSHTKNIYLKLNVHSRAEVAAMFGKWR